MDPLVRLLRHVEVDRESGCWLWTGAVGTGTGYGRFRMGSRVDDTVRTEQAHRVSYELHVGPIPDGLHLDHLCRVRRCVNPDHLEPVTQAENNRRGVSPIAAFVDATHCIHGHEFTPENTYRTDKGRYCRACRRRRNRDLRARKSQAKEADRVSSDV